MTQTQHPAGTREIRRIHVRAIGSDTDRFYADYAREPLIVEGVFEPDHPIRLLTLEEIGTALGNTKMQSYAAETQGYHEVPAPEILTGIRQGQAKFNVVDHYIAGTPVGDLFEVPAFLRHNWFLGAPLHLDELEKCIVLSAAGSFTSLHLDSYGMQGWMYLIEGCKSWEFYSPRHLMAAFDSHQRRFYDPRKSDPDQFPLLPFATKYTGTARGGDLLYFPAGWIHQVETSDASFGIGGSLLNDYQIGDHMRCWLWERTFQFHDDVDLKQAIEAMPADRFSGPEGRARADAALALCASWETRIRELSPPLSLTASGQ